MTTTFTGTRYHDLAADAEGFLANSSDWTEEIAAEIARENGIDALTDRHWTVVRFMRDRFLTTGSAPTIRTLGKESGVPIKELYQLFPKGPAKLAAKIGGIPKPHGCI
jgi:dissimilatory sulfite reductase related protein